MTNPSFHPPRSAGEPRTPVGEGGDTREALATVLHGAFCPCGDYVEHERLALDRFNISSCERLAAAVLAAGYRRVENLGPIERGSVLVFRDIDPLAMPEAYEVAREQLSARAGHDEFLLIVLTEGADLLGDQEVVERVAEAIHDRQCYRDGYELHSHVEHGDGYRDLARAALAALRGGGSS